MEEVAQLYEVGFYYDEIMGFVWTDPEGVYKRDDYIRSPNYTSVGKFAVVDGKRWKIRTSREAYIREYED